MSKITPYTHVIPEPEFTREIKRLTDALAANGYDATGMDFTDLAARKMGDNCARLLSAKGAQIKNHSWELTWSRDIKVKFYLPREGDVALAQEVLG